MPEKNPDIYAQLWAWISAKLANHNIILCSVVIAFFVSLIKSFLYAQKDTPKRVFAEACLCSLIVFSVNPILVHSQWDNSFIIPIGTMIGMFGTSIIRQLIFRWLKRRGYLE